MWTLVVWHPLSCRLPFSSRAITKDSTNKPSSHKPLKKPMQHTKKLIPQPLPYPTNPSNANKNSAKIQSPTGPYPPTTTNPSQFTLSTLIELSTERRSNEARLSWRHPSRRKLSTASLGQSREGLPRWMTRWLDGTVSFLAGEIRKIGRVHTLTNTSVWHYMLLQVHRRFPLDTNGRETLKKKTC